MSTINFAAQPVFVSTGNIRPGRVVVRSTTVARQGSEATGATVEPVGISKNGYKFTNSIYDGSVYAYCAVSGDPIPYAGPGEIAVAVAGAAISALGSPVCSDGQGRVITAVPGAPGTTINYTVGEPLATAAAAGDLIPVLVKITQINV